MYSLREDNKMGIAHGALRAALGTAIDFGINHAKKDSEKGLLDIVDMFEKYLPATKRDANGTNVFSHARALIGDPKSKWARYANSLLHDIDQNVLKTTLLNLAYEAGYKGLEKAREISDREDCNVPWAILFDPTSACNLHCTGCWAAEYGNKLNLSYDVMDKIVKEGKELGTHFFLMTGGEPLVRKDDIIKLCKKHSDCAFHAFTNGTLVDDAFCKQMLEVGNLSLSLSVEGFEEVNDGRRGNGTYEKVMKAMDLLRENGLLFGTSICYTSKNYKTVTSDEFLDMIIKKGCKFAWYFHYMPVGNDASVELMLDKEQRTYMYHRVRELREQTCDKLIFPIDFQNDGEFVGGCIAGGKNYLHINPNGDVEPCVFIHYSSANIKEVSLLDALKQPLFMAYRHNQPFNDNLLRPCPMLENPEFLEKMAKETGAKSTDLQSPESAEHLCSKCHEYAAKWQPAADELWEKSGHGCTEKCKNYCSCNK